MKLAEELFLVYDKLKEELLNTYTGIRCECQKYGTNSKNTFTITLEIIILNRAHEDDYGIIFTTNAQLFSQYDRNVKANDNETFILSDVCFGDGTEIASSKELTLMLANEKSNQQVFDVISAFIIEEYKAIKLLLESRYGIN